MALTTKQRTASDAVLSKQLTAMRVAHAAAGVEAALGALGIALREDAQVRVQDAVELMKRGLSDGEGRMGALVARVPGLGPWLAMEMFRATHPSNDVDELPLRPSNVEERTEQEDVAAYLECIGCHMA